MEKSPIDKEGGGDSVLGYMSRISLPEVDSRKVEHMTHEGYAIEYKSGQVVWVPSLDLMVDPHDPPVAVSYLGED